MLESLPFIFAVATILGFLAGLGVGGGSLLILWLTLVLEMDHTQARVINLLFFIPSALISSFFRWKQGKLALPAILPAIFAGCATAALGTWFSTRLELFWIKKLFALLLLVTGLRELMYRKKE